MQLTHALTIAGVLTVGAGTARAQEPPPPPPPAQSSAPQPVPSPAAPPVATPAPAPPGPMELTDEEIRQRRNAIFLMEGVLMKAVNWAAQLTATEIQRVQPGIAMFSTAPVKAHGTYLEGYGVFFEVEIPSVIPSVASLIRSIERDRVGRPNSLPAQPTALTGSSSEAMINPDAHYVQSVKQELVNAMVLHSSSMELRADEWLTVAARDGSEAPGQIGQPSTMVLRIKGGDLAAFFAGRISREEVRRRVLIRGY